LPPRDLNIHDRRHVFLAQTVEENDLVQPVEELRTEMGTHDFHDLRLDAVGVGAVGQVARYWLPRLLVRMISVLVKSTTRPCPSVSRPSSSTCSSTLNTS
jgi:hypothetical protein